MILKYQEQISKTQIIKIFEQEPCRRTVCVNHDYYNLPFPYIYFVLKIVKQGDNYVYEALDGCSLTIYASLKPVQSFNDQCFQLPFDSNYEGVFCSPHQYDNKVFKTQKELEDFVISLWWNVEHTLYYNPFNSLKIWSKSDVENGKWYRRRRVEQFLTKSFIDMVNFAYSDMGLKILSPTFEFGTVS